MTFIWYLLPIAVLLVLSALFSGSETALFSLTHAKRDRLKQVNPKASGRVEKLLGKPAQLLGTLLLANLLVSTTASAVFTLALIAYARSIGASPGLHLGIGGLVMTGVLLIFGDVTPKLIASHRTEAIAVLASPLLEPFRLILTPATVLLTKLGSMLTPRTSEPESLTKEELQTMIRVGRERGVIVEREEEILWNLTRIEDRTVSEIMTPRIDMFCLDRNTILKDAARAIREAKHSRVPVFDRTVDNIVGFLYAKELLTAPDQTAPVSSVARPAYFVPEVKKLPPLLEELRRKGSHIAVVVDEFGQTAGLVTLEDVLEAIFGEITDEYDAAEEELPYFKLDRDSYLVDGEIDIATLDRLFRGRFSRVRHERLSSLIHERLGRLPAAGDVVRLGSLEITVQEIDGRKLEKVLITKSPTRLGGERPPH